MEAELAAQSRDIERSRRTTMLGEIGAGIVHQIAQPLCAVTNNVAAAKARIGRCEIQSCDALGIVVDVEEDVRRMGAIVERLRLLAHPERARREPVALDELVATILRLADLGADFARILFETRFEPDIVRVAADPVQISQVILNLVQNAIDALGSSERTERRITIATRSPEPGFAELSISDNGPGIDPSHLPRLFDFFFASKDDGIGLGLPISQRIVAAHGGKIEAANNEDAPGATFRVTLPTENPKP